MIFPEAFHLSILPPLANCSTDKGHCSTSWTVSAFLLQALSLAVRQKMQCRAMQEAAAKVVSNLRDSQCSHIRRRNAASWSVLLFSYVPRSSSLKIPLGSLFIKSFKHSFMSSPCTTAKCHKLCNMGKPKQASSLPYPFQQLCLSAELGMGGRWEGCSPPLLLFCPRPPINCQQISDCRLSWNIC